MIGAPPQWVADAYREHLRRNGGPTMRGGASYDVDGRQYVLCRRCSGAYRVRVSNPQGSTYTDHYCAYEAVEALYGAILRDLLAARCAHE